MNPSSFFQFIIGFFLGVILFGAGIAGGAYFFLTNVAVNPTKQVFSEEKPTPKKEEPPKPVEATKQETPSPAQVKEETQESTEELPAGAYKAKVTWSSGLSLRSDASRDAQRVGGIDYNTEVIILTTSNDGQWQKVRVPSSGQEGWVKAGNVEKIN